MGARDGKEDYTTGSQSEAMETSRHQRKKYSKWKKLQRCMGQSMEKHKEHEDRLKSKSTMSQGKKDYKVHDHREGINRGERMKIVNREVCQIQIGKLKRSVIGKIINPVDFTLLSEELIKGDCHIVDINHFEEVIT